jgi:hypothetical protein
VANVVARHLRFAWFEYEDADDAVWFDQTFNSSVMGWTNVLEELGGVGARRFDLAHRDLDIVFVRSTDGKATGTIAFPLDSHAEFITQWLFNPGVNENQSTLTTGADATGHAELVSLSGHHAAGDVWGISKAIGRKITSTLDLGDQIRKLKSPTSSGHLKYLLMPACYTCSLDVADMWLPFFRTGIPLHGVLGYSKTYKGDRTGAQIMRSFGKELQSDPKTTILHAWAAANRGQPWGAVLHEDAVSDTIEAWTSDAGLGKLTTTANILQFDASNLASGGDRIELGTPKYQARFRLADGTTITSANNNPRRKNGLRGGDSGSIVLTANDGEKFAANTTITIVFYYYRPQKRDMNLDTLLTFSSSLLQTDASLGGPRITLLKDANVQKEGGPTGFNDGIQVRADAKDTQITLDYTVNSNAASSYPSDGTQNTHGRFMLYVFPPGTVTTNPRAAISMYADGIWLFG